MTAAAENRTSFEDFLALGSDEAARHTEYVDGIVIVPPDPTARHQDLVGGLYIQLVAQLSRRLVALGGNWLLRPGLLRVPDLRILAEPYDGLYTSTPPLVVVEVTSPSNAATDWLTKANEYNAAGAGEYWLIDQAGATLTVLTRGPNGEWVPTVHPADELAVELDSAAGHLRLDLRELFD